jgi:hypothetical protein
MRKPLLLKDPASWTETTLFLLDACTLSPGRKTIGNLFLAGNIARTHRADAELDSLFPLHDPFRLTLPQALISQLFIRL